MTRKVKLEHGAKTKEPLPDPAPPRALTDDESFLEGRQRSLRFRLNSLNRQGPCFLTDEERRSKEHSLRMQLDLINWRRATLMPMHPHQVDELISKRVTATREVHTRLLAVRARILSKLSGLVSDMSEMKRSLIPEPPKIETLDIIEKEIDIKSLTLGSFAGKPLSISDTPLGGGTVKMLNEMHPRLEAELCKLSQILSTLTGCVSDMSKMKCLLTEPPEIKIDIQEEMPMCSDQLDVYPYYRVAIRRVLIRLEEERARISSMFSGLISGMSEMKRLIPEPPDIKILDSVEQGLVRKHVTFGSFADHPPPISLDHHTLERVDEIRTTLEAELHKRSQILSILTGLVSDMSIMKRLITRPPNILDIDIQEEIMKWLPVKSLVRFRCVSKSWKSLIDSFDFIRTHKNQPQHLLVECCDEKERKPSYVSFADNESFLRLSFVPALPPSISRPIIVGSSYGLLCFYCYYSDEKPRAAVIWNPCIRKSIAIDVPRKEEFSEDDIVLGFGVCPLTLDPKVVHITHLCPPQARRKSESETKKFGKFWKVNVYKLSSGKFTNLSRSSRLPPVSRRIDRRWTWTHVVIDRHIYWCAQKDGMNARSLIMSFDITDEKFQPVDIPDTLATLSSYYLSLSKLRESLVLLEYNDKRDSYGVWKMMDDGVLFTKLFTINAPCGSTSIRAVGFRKTGGPIMELYHSNLRSTPALVAYEEPDSRHCNDLISGFADSYGKNLPEFENR